MTPIQNSPPLATNNLLVTLFSRGRAPALLAARRVLPSAAASHADLRGAEVPASDGASDVDLDTRGAGGAGRGLEAPLARLKPSTSIALQRPETEFTSQVAACSRPKSYSWVL